MRRSFLVSASAAALLVALAVGPFGAAATGPYVLGCTPVSFFNSGTATTYQVSLSIYNGSASTANVTTKVLAGDGTIRNGSLSGTIIYLPPVTSTIPATKTAAFRWSGATGVPAMDNPNVEASVRIVSNVPVSATLSHDTGVTGADWHPNVCTGQVP